MRATTIIQTIFLLLISLSIWFDLEYIAYTLILARVVETVIYLRALGKHFGIKVFLLWSYLRSSYLLIPFAAFGPILLRISILYTENDPISLFFLSLSGALAATGLIVGIFLLRHPLREEIVRLFVSLFKTRKNSD